MKASTAKGKLDELTKKLLADDVSPEAFDAGLDAGGKLTKAWNKAVLDDMARKIIGSFDSDGALLCIWHWLRSGLITTEQVEEKLLHHKAAEQIKRERRHGQAAD